MFSFLYLLLTTESRLAFISADPFVCLQCALSLGCSSDADENVAKAHIFMEELRTMNNTFLCRGESVRTNAQWFGKAKNQDVSTGPLACSFARSLAPLTHSLAPHYSLCSRAPLRSFVRLLTHFAHSRAHGIVNDLMAICLPIPT